MAFGGVAPVLCGSCAGKILVSGNVGSVTSGVCDFLRGCAWRRGVLLVPRAYVAGGLGVVYIWLHGELP